APGRTPGEFRRAIAAPGRTPGEFRRAIAAPGRTPGEFRRAIAAPGRGRCDRAAKLLLARRNLFREFLLSLTAGDGRQEFEQVTVIEPVVESHHFAAHVHQQLPP